MQTIDEWKEQGKTMLDDLTAERVKLKQRLSEIDSGIATLKESLGAPSSGGDGVPTRRVLRPKIQKFLKANAGEKKTFEEIGELFSDGPVEVSVDSIKVACQRLSKTDEQFVFDVTGMTYTGEEDEGGHGSV